MQRRVQAKPAKEVAPPDRTHLNRTPYRLSYQRAPLGKPESPGTPLAGHFSSSSPGSQDQENLTRAWALLSIPGLSQQRRDGRRRRTEGKGLFQGGKEGRASPLGGLQGIAVPAGAAGAGAQRRALPQGRIPARGGAGRRRDGPAPGSALARCPHTWLSGSRRPTPLRGGEGRGVAGLLRTPGAVLPDHRARPAWIPESGTLWERGRRRPGPVAGVPCAACSAASC